MFDTCERFQRICGEFLADMSNDLPKHFVLWLELFSSSKHGEQLAYIVATV